MTSGTPETERRRTLNRLYKQGRTTSLEILHADFGHWPPQDLTIITVPDVPVTFATVFEFGALGMVKDHDPKTICVDMFLPLKAAFNKSSADLANTLSHENIHILQNNILYRNGLSGSLNLSRKQNYSALLKPGINPAYGQYAASEDEIQPALHAIVTDHYRRHQILPRSTAELWALLRTERVKTESAFVHHLLDHTDEGLQAKKRFPENSGRPHFFLQDEVSEIKRLLGAIKEDRLDGFCEKILPGIYGRLLELYGDRQGCLRMGYDHNMLLSETFFRQSWRLQHERATGLPPKTAKLEETIARMPLSQARCLEENLSRNGAWQHPLINRTLDLKPEMATLAIGLLRNHITY